MACSLFAIAAVLRAALPGPEHTLQLIASAGYLPGIPLLVRVELRDTNGQPDRNVWNAGAILSVDAEAVTLSTNRFTLRNGLGTAFVTPAGSGDFTLTVTVGSLKADRALRDRSGEAIAHVSGTLTGSNTTWRGIILVTNDVTIPANHTLTIESNTIVLIGGVASGTTAPDLFVNGRINSLGTAEHPVTITCASPSLRFGEIRHTSAQPSLYRYTSISRGGRSTGVGHTSSFGGPMFRPSNSQIMFVACNLTDHSGKIMHATSSDLVFDNCVLARAIMGPEIIGTGLLCTNSYIMEIASNDDGDGIYLQSSSGRPLKLTHSVLAGLTGRSDDGIDTLNANATVENCIIRDWYHATDDPKGVSTFNGEVRLSRCIVQDCTIGVSAKANGPPATARVFIQESTIGGISNAVAAAYKDNAVGPNIDIRITNSIVRAPKALRSDFDPTTLTNFQVGYCNVSEAVQGSGNFELDPLFADAPNHDYHLQVGSPCIDAGDPIAPVDPDGSRIDVGCFTFEVPPPRLLNPRLAENGHFELLFSGYTNRNYAVEVSTNAQTWGTLMAITHTNEPRIIVDPMPPAGPLRLYRAQLTR